MHVYHYLVQRKLNGGKVHGPFYTFYFRGSKLLQVANLLNYSLIANLLNIR